MGGFLTTLNKALADDSSLASRRVPGMPLQVFCYERADDIGFGVSGVVTRARAIRQSFPNLDPSQIQMAQPVKHEKVLYLLDPVGASRRSRPLKIADAMIRAFKKILPYRDEAFQLPIIPPFLKKEGGLLLSLGQFNQWVGSQIMGQGLVQIWPGTPVSEPLFSEEGLMGIRLADQGVEKSGAPTAGYMPGMDIQAELTVVGDGPVGAVGRQINERFGMPEGHHQREWAVGMKMVVELPEKCDLEPGLVLHTFGYPEPEIFGFLYVYADRLASLGIFVPSSLGSPVRTAYRYLQHWMTHPYLWKYLNGGKLLSWGAKSLQESGRRGEPFLAGDGFARIGEGSGSTNVLTGSGVDEAWLTGVQLAEGVVELWKEGKPLTRENLDKAYVERRRKSWLDKESRVAEKARDGFQRDFVLGMIGMGMAGTTGGLLSIPGNEKTPFERISTLEAYYRGKISPEELAKIKETCATQGSPLHDAIFNRLGWPEIQLDGKLLISHQDALLLGGKVQAPDGYADHVVFLDKSLCQRCGAKVCIEGCSGQAITAGEGGVPQFDREKCVYCGACLWNCSQSRSGDRERGNMEFRAGAGGLHSSIN